MFLKQVREFYEMEEVPKRGTPPIQCFLYEEDEIVWQFQYNPELISRSGGSTLSEVNVPGEIGALFWAGTIAERLEIPNILIDVGEDNLSAEPMLERLKALNEGGVPLTLVWGQRREGPLLLESYSLSEEGWNQGQFSTGRLSLTFVKVPLLQ